MALRILALLIVLVSVMVACEDKPADEQQSVQKVQAPSPADPIAEKLTRARNNHDFQLDQARDNLLAAFDLQIAKKADTGELDIVKPIVTSKEQFEKHGLLPEMDLMAPTVKTHIASCLSADKGLQSALTEAMQAYTKIMKLELATQTQEQLHLLQAQMAKRFKPDPTDLSIPFTQPAQVRRLSGHIGPISRLRYLSDGRHAISSSSDNTVRLWDIQTGKMIQMFQGMSHIATGIDVSDDGGIVVAASYQGGARVWNGLTGEQLLHIKASKAGFGVVVSADGQYMGTGGNYRFKLWAIADGKLIANPQFSAYSIDIHQGKDWFVQGGWDGKFKVYDLKTHKAIHTSPPSAGHIYGIEFSRDGQWMATANTGGITRVWRTEDWTAIAKFEGHKKVSHPFSISDDGKRLIGCDDEKIARLWNIESGKLIHQFKEITGEMAISPDGRFALVGDQNDLVLWRLPDPSP